LARRHRPISDHLFGFCRILQSGFDLRQVFISILDAVYGELTIVGISIRSNVVANSSLVSRPF
jgi:hypothetical protein